MSQDCKTFIERLDEHHDWPCEYTFKFIVPVDQLKTLLNVIKSDAVSTRESKSGKYISVTWETEMCSGTDVYAVYEEVAKVPGVMCL